MKTSLIIFTLLIGCSFIGSSQEVIDIQSIDPSKSYENILVEPIESDSLASSFIIWIKNGVKAHFHAHHTEYVYIVEGFGEMMLNEESKTVKPGDLVYLRANTVHSVEVTSSYPMKVISIQCPQFVGNDRIFVRPKD